MSTVNWKKSVCKHGHVDPVRYPSGACIQCSKIATAARYEKDPARAKTQAVAFAKLNPEARRDYGRAGRLGVTVVEVRDAIARCSGKCEACAKPLTHALMCVDHDHKTGVIRGVLEQGAAS